MLSLDSGRFCSFSTPMSRSKAIETLKRTRAILVSCRIDKAYVNREADK